MAETTLMDERELERRGRALAELDDLAKRFGTSLSQALKAGASGGRDLDGVLGSIGRSLQAMLVKGGLAPLEAALQGGARSLFQALGGRILAGAPTMPFAKGGTIGPVTAFAAGGVVAAPSYFPLGRGLGLMGEAGAEAVMPLARGSDGRLGVRAAGEPRPVAITVNIATPDADSFRRSQAQVAAALARAVARGRRAL